MNRTVTVAALLVTTFLAPACNNPSAPDGHIDTVDKLLAQVCRLAANCPGISATAQELDDCPLQLRSQLGPPAIADLEQFSTLSTAQQGTVLTCIGAAICHRFGGRLESMSDSDLMDPYRTCMRGA